MLQREKVYEWVSGCGYIGLLFYFAYSIWDYTVLYAISSLFFIGAVVMLLLSCCLSWRDTHSLRQVFRQNRLWLTRLLLLPIALYVLFNLLRRM